MGEQWVARLAMAVVCLVTGCLEAPEDGHCLSGAHCSDGGPDTSGSHDAATSVGDAGTTSILSITVMGSEPGQVALSNLGGDRFCNQRAPCDFELDTGQPVELYATPTDTFTSWDIAPCQHTTNKNTANLSLTGNCSVVATFGSPEM